MTGLIVTVFVASLTGSLHCAGMCGAFVAFAVGTNEDTKGRLWLHVAYNGGRLLTYMVLGAIGGLIGRAIDLGGSMVGVQQTAAVMAGAMMVAFGVIALLHARGVRVPVLGPPRFMARLLTRGHRAAMARPPIVRAALIGLLTTLLPCGWLYFFILVAAGTGGPATGALTMAIFWVGTLPIMITVGVGVQALTGPLRRHVPTLTALLLVAVGLYVVIDRSAMPAMASLMGTDPINPDQALEQLSGPPPAPVCCDDTP